MFTTALAITAGDPNLGLQRFENVDELAIKRAEKLVKKNIIDIDVEDAIKKLGKFCSEGMELADENTIEIMLQR